MFQLRTNSGITWLESTLLRRCGGLRHAFSTRLGGVCEAPRQTLNLSFVIGDDERHVAENRRRFLKRFDLSPEQAVTLDFIHSAKTVDVTAADAGKGYMDPATTLADADGMVSSAEGIALFITFSDCAPLLFYDPVRRVVAASHSGWRGTVRGMPQATINHMQEVYGSEAKDIRVAQGPTIDSRAYKVGHDVVKAYRKRYPNWRRLFRPCGSGKPALDLRLAIRWQLEAQGVLAEHIDVSEMSTFTREDLLFSYRRSGPGRYGVMGAFIYMEPQG